MTGDDMTKGDMTKNDMTKNWEGGAPCERDWTTLQRVAIDKALAGDMYAAWICLQMKIAEARLVTIELPTVHDAAGLDKAQAAVIAAAGKGLPPRDAMIYSRLLENRRRAIATRDLEARLTAIEDANRERDRKALFHGET